jgi:predicted metal-binding membrane protein
MSLEDRRVGSAAAGATGVVARREARHELADAFAAARAAPGLIALLFALAAAAWWWTSRRMAGMDAGPGTDLGALGWFAGVWVVMMGAMMLPSLSPTVALYARMARGAGWMRAVLFACGYLAVWAGAGVFAYGLLRLGANVFADALAWRSGGRWCAGAVLLAAAIYQLTPAKHLCLQTCRSPLGLLRGAACDGARGALMMGARAGAWCVGCCWALMAALFALGVMSLTWMALTAGLIALEKALPWRRPATWSTAAVLVALAAGLLADPHSVPGLVVPGGAHASAHTMSQMTP